MVDETAGSNVPAENDSAGDSVDPVTKDLLEAMATNSLVLECPEITLTQNAPTPEIIRGRGSISLLDQPHFELKMYADPGTDGLRELQQLESWISGTIIPDSEYYALKATDLNGVVWQWERVHINRSGFGPVLVRASCEGLKQISRCRPSAPSVTLFFYDQPGVAYNQYVKRTTTVAGESRHSMELGAATFETPEFDIRVRPAPTRDGPLSIRITFKSHTIAAGAEYRLAEALSYATFCPVSWCITRKEHAGVREVSLTPRTTARPSLIDSPVPAQPGYDASSFWSLFTAYLKHVIQYSDSDRYSPLSAQLRPLIYSETRELVVLALLLGVTVEGVLNLEFSALAAPSDAFKDAIEHTKEALKGLQSIDPEVQRRARGALDAMKMARAGDRLKLLVDRGVITQRMFEDWRTLRNASAHATISPKSHDDQKLWSQCNTVATLLNLLVFTAIGYSGKYVDYSATMWPSKSFTPPSLDGAPSNAAGT